MATSVSDAKIALTCSGLSHVRRGVEAWSQEAFDALRGRGLDVTLFQGSGDNGRPAVRVLSCIRRGSPLSKALRRVLPRGSWRLGLGSTYQMEQTTFAFSLLAAGAGRFDLLHTKDPQVAAMLQWARRRGLSRAKVILNHGTEEPPQFLSRFDYVQHLAPSHRDEALAQGARLRRHFVVPNFVDTEKFRPGTNLELRQRLGIPPEAVVALCVAAVKRRHKRLDWLMEEVARAAGQAPQPLWLVIAGARTEETGGLVVLAAQRLGERVRMLVNHPRDAMPALYRAADVFVLTSLKEMLPNAMLEALASGLPCLGSRHPAMQWVIGQGGETLDMEQPGALAAALVRAADPAYRARVGPQARAQAQARFAIPVVLEQQLAMYREVLG